MTKALSDDWMWDHGFVDGDVIKPKKYQSWWATKRVCDLPMNTPLTITSDVPCKHAISLLKREGFDMVPVLDDGHVIGVVTEGVSILHRFSFTANIAAHQPVSRHYRT